MTDLNSAIIKASMYSQRLLKNIATEAEILAKLPDNLKEEFKEKFSKSINNYWQTISEARALVVFNDIGISIKETDSKTFKDKNVDFLALFENENIYVEVKGFQPENFDVAEKGGTVGPCDNKIRKALDRARDKFLESSCNILVIADEDGVKMSLFVNPQIDIYKSPETYLSNFDYIKISAIVILGNSDEEKFNFKIWYNSNPQKSLPEGLVEIFDQKKCNMY